jgi:hypothetical protein
VKKLIVHTQTQILNKNYFSQYWPSGTVASDAMAYVVDDYDCVFQIQANLTQNLMRTLTALVFKENKPWQFQELSY